MAVWETVLCFGDSLTEGTRTYAGYPEYLACYLREKTDRIWICINRGVRRERVIDLLRRLEYELRVYNDVFTATLLIGTNDLKRPQTDIETFEEIYCQVLERFFCRRVSLFVGLIPDIKENCCFPYDSRSREGVALYNQVIRKLCKSFGFSIVDLTGLPDECYVDGVHFSEIGCQEVARRFGEAILKR